MPGFTAVIGYSARGHVFGTEGRGDLWVRHSSLTLLETRLLFCPAGLAEHSLKATDRWMEMLPNNFNPFSRGMIEKRGRKFAGRI